MSRSYKKTPYCGDKKNKITKRIANHTVRQWLKDHPEEILQGGSFRKIFCSYDICDYYWILPWEEYRKGNKFWYPEDSDAEIRNRWEKYYYRK